MFVAPTAAVPEVAGGSVADGSATDGSRYAVLKRARSLPRRAKLPLGQDAKLAFVSCLHVRYLCLCSTNPSSSPCFLESDRKESKISEQRI